MTPVLIVGAGPTGLVLALWLTRIGVKVRIIDKASRAGTTSRAIVVHARTLEFYRQLGISEEITSKGFRFPNLNLWVEKKRRARFDISHLGAGATPFPYIMCLPQDEHEEILIAKLKELGVNIERSTELLSFEQDKEKVTAQIKLADGKTETVEARYLAGCDGARSVVRHEIHAEFAGGTYPDWFYVADVEGTGPVLDGELHLSLDRSEFLGVFPLKEPGKARLIGVIRTEGDGSKFTWEDVNPRLVKEMNVHIKKVNWFSTYHVHHRVAAQFQDKRAFILGDASHIHSPVGGQGMNTGIGDAVNLAWKLGEVLQGKASADLLETYGVERIPFAKRLVNTTDQAFKFVSSTGRLARVVRTRVAPVVLPRVVGYRSSRRLFFRILSQTGINYRHCSLNQGRAGRLRAGDRLPWIESVDNFAKLKSLSAQIHVYGEKKVENAIHFPWNQEMADKGLRKDAAYLIRPDGYIGRIVT